MLGNLTQPISVEKTQVARTCSAYEKTEPTFLVAKTDYCFPQASDPPPYLIFQPRIRDIFPNTFLQPRPPSLATPFHQQRERLGLVDRDPFYHLPLIAD